MSYDTRDLSRDDTQSSPPPTALTTSTQRARDPIRITKPIRHPKSKVRRDMMRALRICINGHFLVPRLDADGEPMPPRERSAFDRPIIEHGPAVKGGRCQRCIDVRESSKPPRKPPREGVVRATPPYVLLRLPKPGLRRRVFLELLLSGMAGADVAAVQNTTLANVHSAVRRARRMGELLA